MFVTVSTYQARAGEEDAIVALHEDWQCTLQPKAAGYISGELLRNAANVRQFLAIMRFERQEFFQELADAPEQQVWMQRLESLVEIVPVHHVYASEWLSPQAFR
jgi:antibiotic biosynthesis monooxygenase (ABM) superfamily enzyme